MATRVSAYSGRDFEEMQHQIMAYEQAVATARENVGASRKRKRDKVTALRPLPACTR